MELKNYFAQDTAGNVLPNATVYLYLPDTTAPAEGLQKANGDALANPFQATEEGLIQFKAPNSEYDLRVVSHGRDYTLRVQCNDVRDAVQVDDLLSNGPGKGSWMVAADDGASGSLWTTVAGFIAKIMSSAGASVIGFIQDGARAVRRSIQDKLREQVSLLDFGAIGDGYQNDTDAILASIASNRRIFVPEGYTFLCSGVEVIGMDNFYIYGGGIIKLANASNKQVLRFNTCTNFTIDGIGIDGNSANQTETASRNLGSGISVYNCLNWTVKNNKVNNTYSGAGIIAIDNGSTATEVKNNGLIKNNIITNAGKVGGPLSSDGIFANSDNIIIENNTIDGTTDYGIAGDYSKHLKIKYNNLKNIAVTGIGILGAYDWIVSGNTIDVAGQGIAITLSGNPSISPYISDNVKITNNTISNITRHVSGTPNGDGIFIDTSAKNVLIYNNTIDSTYRGIGSDASDVVCVHNTIDTTIDRSISCSGAGSIIGPNKIINGGIAPYYGSTISNKTLIEDGPLSTIYISTFLGGWSNYGGMQKPAGFYRQGNRVFLTGAVKGGTLSAGQPIFNLPSGYRPEYDCGFAVSDYNGIGSLSVNASGAVLYRSGTGTLLWLDGISFIAA